MIQDASLIKFEFCNSNYHNLLKLMGHNVTITKFSNLIGSVRAHL